MAWPPPCVAMFRQMLEDDRRRAGCFTFACGTFECTEGFVEQTLQLRGKK
jgi:hypothetical protein